MVTKIEFHGIIMKSAHLISAIPEKCSFKVKSKSKININKDKNRRSVTAKAANKNLLGLFIMYPCCFEGRQAPGLYTYYALMSLMVVALAISLIWIPFLQLITEMNIIITKMVIYLNVELIGYKNANFPRALETAFLSQNSLIVISACCVAYILYLASGDFLLFAGCYICHLPNTKCLIKLKKLALRLIGYLLNLTGKTNKPPIKQKTRIDDSNHSN